MIRAQGVIRGNQIELMHETGLPSGSVVEIQIEQKQLSLDEKLALVGELCGVWANDASIQAIFLDMEKQRWQ